MKFFRLVVALTLALSTARADEKLDAHLADQSSPDGRFVLRAVADEDGLASRVIVVEPGAKNRTVADVGGDVMLSALDSIRVVWADDARRFAVNFRAGGRYETTSFYRWEKDAFVETEFPESAIYERIIKPARKRELKAAGKPADTSLHRVWDRWETVKWLGENTAAVHGDSIAAYDDNGEDTDIATGVDVTLKFGADGKAAIVEAKEVPVSD